MPRRRRIKSRRAAVRVRKPTAPPVRVHPGAKTYARERERERLRREKDEV